MQYCIRRVEYAILHTPYCTCNIAYAELLALLMHRCICNNPYAALDLISKSISSEMTSGNIQPHIEICNNAYATPHMQYCICSNAYTVLRTQYCRCNIAYALLRMQRCICATAYEILNTLYWICNTS